MSAASPDAATQAVWSRIEDLKRGGGAVAGFPRPIAWQGATIGHLEPMTHADLGDAAFVERLCAWRNRHHLKFFTASKVTPESTRRWLGELILARPDRIMFKVTDAVGRLVGQCGVCNASAASAELDGIIRGEALGRGNLMVLAERVLFDWLMGDLGVQRLVARIFADNIASLRLFLDLGMTIARHEMFERVEEDGVVRYQPTDDPAPPDGRKIAILELGAAIQR
jgi:RimJ/RimL family protein N-acetyltransferase